NQIPIGMKMFPGNQSEKPIMRDVVNDLRNTYQINGRTIHVADKGLNCADNIAFAKENGDGYLFSKSVKMLPETEQTWVTMDSDDWEEVRDKEGHLIYKYKSCVDQFPYNITIDENTGKKKILMFKEKRVLTYNPKLATKKKYEIEKQAEKARELCYSQAKRSEFGDLGKYVDFINGKGGKAKAKINQEAIDKERKLAGYNLLVTSETKMSEREIYETYHNLWRIEESFKIMKSDLDARPVFLQKESTIKGHFLICYLSVLLERLLQFKVFNKEFSTYEIMKFTREFRLVKGESKYINITTSSRFIKEFAKLSKLPLTNYYLTERQIKQILNYKI
ncbi:IS1634 family transposase, partial [Massilimicrobiota timonensis]